MPIDGILRGAYHGRSLSVWTEEDHLGPAAQHKVYRFVVDSRDDGGKVRVPSWDSACCARRCHTITNCVGACPKELDPMEGMQWLKMATVRRRLFRGSV